MQRHGRALGDGLSRRLERDPRRCRSRSHRRSARLSASTRHERGRRRRCRRRRARRPGGRSAAVSAAAARARSNEWESAHDPQVAHRGGLVPREPDVPAIRSPRPSQGAIGCFDGPMIIAEPPEVARCDSDQQSGTPAGTWDSDSEHVLGASGCPGLLRLSAVAVTPSPDLVLTSIDGQARPLAGVAHHVPPRQRGARPLHQRERVDPAHRRARVLEGFRGSDARVNLVVTCTRSRSSRSFLGPLTEQFLVFCDPDRSPS